MCMHQTRKLLPGLINSYVINHDALVIQTYITINGNMLLMMQEAYRKVLAHSFDGVYIFYQQVKAPLFLPVLCAAFTSPFLSVSLSQGFI